MTVTIVDMASILRELIDTLLKALQEQGLEVRRAGSGSDGDIYLECRLPRPGDGEGTFVINVSNIARDVVFVDRDQPELGIDEAILVPDTRTEKIRAVVAQRMAIIEAMLQPDEKERQKALERVGQHSGRLRVWTGAPDEKPQLVLWYEHGQPVQ